MDAVGARRQGLALDEDLVTGGEHGVLVGATPPRALVATGAEAEVGHAERNEAAPDLAVTVLALGAVDVGAVVSDRHPGDTDTLGDGRILVVAGRRQSEAGDLSGGRQGGEEHDRGQQDEGADEISGHVRSSISIVSSFYAASAGRFGGRL